jgi:hypothetical protein
VTYNDNFICKNCDPICGECIALADRCTECTAPKFLDGFTCVEDCGPGKIGRLTQRDCVSCPSNCTSCSNNICDGCKDNLLYENGLCNNSQCADNYTMVSGVCEACKDPCVNCQNAIDECTSCAAGFTLEGTICKNLETGVKFEAILSDEAEFLEAPEYDEKIERVVYVKIFLTSKDEKFTYSKLKSFDLEIENGYSNWVSIQFVQFFTINTEYMLQVKLPISLELKQDTDYNIRVTH